MQAELRPGDRIAGCVVESELGRGGMGVVYRARQESLQRTVAVKVISPALAGDAGFARRFEREARLAASIEHPSVVPIHAAGEEDGRLYLVMRFVDGTDLFNEVASHGPLVPQRVARASRPARGRAGRRPRPRPGAPRRQAGQRPAAPRLRLPRAPTRSRRPQATAGPAAPRRRSTPAWTA